MPPKMAFNEYDLVASISRESFYDFVREFWGTVVPEKAVWNWHIKYLCDELQTMAERVFAGKPKEYDLIINISPGSTKSTIASVMFPAWTWARSPAIRCICGSYAYALAMDLSRKSRDIVKCEKYQKCFPDVKLREDQDTKGYYVSTAGGMRYAVGSGGAVTGMHGHFIIVDDPLDPSMAVSEAELKSTNDWMNETLPTRKVDKKITPTILIMQRLHVNDPSGQRLENTIAGPVKHICLDAILSDNVKPPELKKFYFDGLFDPIRLPLDVLRQAEGQLGQYGYAGQYRQTPSPPGGGMFKVGRIAIEPEPANIVRKVRYWDKAATADAGAFTVGALIGKDGEGNFWVLDVVRGQWASNDREQRILQTASLDGRRVVIGLEQEGGSGGKDSALATTRMLAGFRTRLDRPTGDKIWRADPFSAAVNGGFVKIVKAPWNAAYLQELEYFGPAAAYKDQVDASSGGFNMLTALKRKVGALQKSASR